MANFMLTGQKKNSRVSTGAGAMNRDVKIYQMRVERINDL
jgi:hypothetical protein